MRQNEAPTFPRVNFLPDRELTRATLRPLVRLRFWIALGLSSAGLIGILAWQLLPAIAVPR